MHRYRAFTPSHPLRLPLLRILPTPFFPPRPRLFSSRPSRYARSPNACAPAAASPPSLAGQTLVVTTPLFYVNAAPHMGSAYPTIAADALARFYRMAGAHTIFITGTDEHGEKIANAAAAAAAANPSSSPVDTRAFCDHVSLQFKLLWEQLNIQYDRFVRTTDDHHKLLVATFMDRVWDNGDIYKSLYHGLYCTACEEYKDENDLLARNICPLHQTTCTSRKEDNYFFALSKYQDTLETFLHDNPSFILPPERRNEVMQWLKMGVRDFSISRANNPWGIPVPKDDKQTIYVWFDALIGYLSALLQTSQIPSLDHLAKNGWPADVHIIGKDILRFHALYWPAMLMSAGLPLPRRIFAHGFITKDAVKMGKTLGNTLDPTQLIASYGSDAVRYYFLKAVDFGKDGDFSEQRFIEIVNSDLANSLGNLLNRSLNLLKKNCAANLPMSSAQIDMASASQSEKLLRQAADSAYQNAYVHYEALNFDAACETIMAVSFAANAHIDRIAPWTKFKSDNPEDIHIARRCLVNVLEASRIVAVGLSPIVPILSRNVYEALGLGDEFSQGLTWDQMKWGRLTEGMSFANPKPVFPRLELVAPEAAVM